LIDPSSIILEQWACLNGITSLDPELQNRNRRAALGSISSVYINESWNFGQTIWAKSEVLLGTSWGTVEELENHLRTREIYIYIPLRPYQKEKNWTVHECTLSLPMKFLFPKLFVTTLAKKELPSLCLDAVACECLLLRVWHHPTNFCCACREMQSTC
jgi:hypothetical protein